MLTFELEKFRKYIFGKKSEKLSALQAGGRAAESVFELGTTQAQQEALSRQACQGESEPKKPNKRAKVAEEWYCRRVLEEKQLL